MPTGINKGRTLEVSPPATDGLVERIATLNELDRAEVCLALAKEAATALTRCHAEIAALRESLARAGASIRDERVREMLQRRRADAVSLGGSSEIAVEEIDELLKAIGGESGYDGKGRRHAP